MKIEVLFPEVANLYGDLSNIEYLKKCLNNDVEIIETSLNDEPAFVKQDDINLIFMAGMTEKSQEIVIKKLKPYADRIDELVSKNQPVLLLGNAMEILGKFIENEDESQIRAVGLYHFYAHRDMMHRYSGYYLGKHKDIEIVGFKAQFTTTYGNNDECYEIGYALGKKYWRNGYATESLKAVVEFLIKEVGISKFLCRCAKKNQASGSVIRKVGFEYKGKGKFTSLDGKRNYESEEYYLER